MTGAEVDEARRVAAVTLTDRIRHTAARVRYGLYDLRALVSEAKETRAWETLGFASWTAYLAETLGDEPLRLERAERQELVGYLAGEGMTTRAIAPIVGVGLGTVHRDIQAGVPNGTPAPVTGLDGKTYPRKPKPEADPAPFVERYPELGHYVEAGKPEDAVRIGSFLNTVPDGELPVRREAVRAHIAAEPADVAEDATGPLLKAVQAYASANVAAAAIGSPEAVGDAAMQLSPQAIEAARPILAAAAEHIAVLSAAVYPRLRLVK